MITTIESKRLILEYANKSFKYPIHNYEKLGVTR